MSNDTLMQYNFANFSLEKYESNCITNIPHQLKPESWCVFFYFKFIFLFFTY